LASHLRGAGAEVCEVGAGAVAGGRPLDCTTHAK